MPLLPDINASSINSDDAQKQIESVVKQVNEGFRLISNEERTKITKDDAGDQRLLIGYQEDGFDSGNVGVKLSQEGVDVAGATDDQLIFSTDFNLFKIVQSGSQTETLAHTSNTVAAGTQTITIAHSLGYKPSHLVYITTPSTYINGSILTLLPELHVLPAGHALGGGTIFNKFYATVDTTNLYVKFFHRVGTDYSPDTPTFTIKYYLMRETAS